MTGWEGREESGSGDRLQPVPAPMEEGSPRCRIKPPALWGLISARSATGSGSWVPREGRTWDVGGGHRQLWLRAEEPSGRVWGRQLSETEEEE